jgi:hypothetical protein
MEAPAQTPAQQVVIMAAPKSMGIAIILSALFGPLGMLYATVPGGLIMMVICFVVGLFTLGLGALLLWPVCIAWTAVAVSSHNKRLSGMLQAQG